MEKDTENKESGDVMSWDDIRRELGIPSLDEAQKLSVSLNPYVNKREVEPRRRRNTRRKYKNGRDNRIPLIDAIRKLKSAMEKHEKTAKEIDDLIEKKEKAKASTELKIAKIVCSCRPWDVKD